LYFLFNAMIFTVICIMSIYTMIRNPEFWPGWILLVFPTIGMFAGRWIRIGKYGLWRSIVMGLSFLYFIGFLLAVFVLGPQMEKLKEQKFAEMQAVRLDEDTEQFFVGVYASDVNVVKEYLDKGIDVNVVNETQQTALHITQSEEIVRLLIDRGADVNAVDEYQMTPMFNKEVPLVKILVEAGADFNAKSEKGNTPLMWYCYSGYLEGIKYMVSLGADVNVVNVDGQTAYDIAEYAHPLELLDYLKSVGAKSGKDIK